MEDFYSSELFCGVSPQEYDKMIECFQPIVKSFKAGDLVCDYSFFNENVAIVQNGELQMIRIDSDGNRTILENLGTNSVFGKVLTFIPVQPDDSFFLVCTKDCAVMFIEYRHIVRRCEKACTHHSKLVENMLRLISMRAVELSLKVEILSQRSIRGKLTAYFKSEAQRQQKKNCKIGFSYSDLADYLCVDRCAMMRELKKMREENIVQTNGKTFSLVCENQ